MILLWSTLLNCSDDLRAAALLHAVYTEARRGNQNLLFMQSQNKLTEVTLSQYVKYVLYIRTVTFMMRLMSPASWCKLSTVLVQLIQEVAGKIKLLMTHLVFFCSDTLDEVLLIIKLNNNNAYVEDYRCVVEVTTTYQGGL